MLHLHALAPIVGLDVAPADALLVSTVNPGKMARVTFFDGDFMALHQALEDGQLANVGQPLECQEVEDWVTRALGEIPASTRNRQSA